MDGSQTFNVLTWCAAHLVVLMQEIALNRHVVVPQSVEVKTLVIPGHLALMKVAARKMIQVRCVMMCACPNPMSQFMLNCLLDAACARHIISTSIALMSPLCLGRCQQIQRTCGCQKDAQLSHSFVLNIDPAADHTDPPYAMSISKPTAAFLCQPGTSYPSAAKLRDS